MNESVLGWDVSQRADSEPSALFPSTKTPVPAEEGLRADENNPGEQQRGSKGEQKPARQRNQAPGPWHPSPS